MTLHLALQSAATRLATDAHLADTARRDAEQLLLHILDITRASLIADPNRAITPEQQSAYEALIARRLRHEPIQYITGTQEFYGIPLRVTPAVLIPRPETELLVESVLERLAPDQPLALADIGTGSGAIAIAIAAHLPQAHVTAIDLSPAALRVAQSNAEARHLSGRIRFLLSDRLTAIPPQERNFDAIVSNPPYVPTSDAETLHPQVREHEPALALYAGPDGLSVYRLLIPEARHALKPGGLLALEIGHGQADAVAALLSAWDHTTILDDLQGIPRVILARR